MWKLIVGFVIFAALALFVLLRSGGNIDMGGEKHGSETAPAAEAISAPVTPVPAPISIASSPASIGASGPK